MVTPFSPPGHEVTNSVNVDFPLWMLEQIDREADRLGVPRQSLIKVWLGERLSQPTKPSRKKKTTQQSVARL